MRKLDEIVATVQKPARYTGGEFGEIIKDPASYSLHFAFCFPDSYDIGMSHLGMKLLYSLINRREDAYCERVFAPSLEMGGKLKEAGLPLYSLETKTPLADFDVIGFTLQYELSYTNILYMLDLAGVPLRSADRKDRFPLVVGGGPCAVNAEPIADYFDLFMIGDGEDVMNELLDLVSEYKKEGYGKKEFLKKAARIEGVYVPSLYDVGYNEDGTVKSITPLEGAPEKVKRCVIKDLDKAFWPESFVVPYSETVHDRACVEVLRGCMRGCRFCQAGYIYRPLRERSPETNNRLARALVKSTGYEELSLLSLSTSDYSRLEELLDMLYSWTDEEKTSISLPSLRVDSFTSKIRDKITGVKKSGLTFAPEAGTQRLRDVINKNVTEEELRRTADIAFDGGYTSLKLYFMCGLPTETEEDLKGILTLAGEIVDLFYHNPNRQKGRSFSLSASVACFVPKPFTPFQWEPQDDVETLLWKQKFLRDYPRSKKISVSVHKPYTSHIEAVFARGDRRLSKVIERAYKEGSVFDSWDENFNYERWIKCLEAEGLSAEFYANRRRSFDEIMPWDVVDARITKEFLKREAEKAYEGKTSPNCREQCMACGCGCKNGKVGEL